MWSSEKHTPLPATLVVVGKGEGVILLWLFLLVGSSAWVVNLIISPTRYWQSVRLLCEFADLQDNWWPWTREAVLAGCMERTHMVYMLDVLEATCQERVLTLQVGGAVGGRALPDDH